MKQINCFNQIKMKNKNEKYTAYYQIINLISVAKYCGLDEISIPFWKKEYPYIPSMFCYDLDNMDETIENLSISFDIKSEDTYVFIDPEDETICKKEQFNFVKCKLVSIKGIQKIKFFGVSEEKALYFKNALAFITKDFKETVLETDSSFADELYSEHLIKPFINYSALSVLFALNECHKTGIQYELKNTRESVERFKYPIFKKTESVNVSSYIIMKKDILSQKIKK